ncbi:MAG: ASCH domain-containing protein [Archaeoglobaceae archaeon]|uniref:ASCH domain-containing protein n=1 Tax=Archaeoglobus fulgidus TaxID=2234 RepID=A0A7J3LZR7_ARCFL
MERINFDTEFVPAILSRAKKTTIRRGIRSYPVGKIVELTVDSKPFAMAKVKKVVVKRVSELSDEDAIVDGFSGKDELIRALKKIYGEIDESEFVTIVHFELI